MAKGSGLSIDLDPISLFLHKPTVLNSFPVENTPTLNTNKKKNPENLSSNSSSGSSRRNLTTTLMDASAAAKRSPPPTIQFPVSVNLNSSCSQEDQNPSDRHHLNRTVIGEMDFFAEKNNNYNNNKLGDRDHDDDGDDDDADADIKIHSTDRTALELNVNVCSYSTLRFFLQKFICIHGIMLELMDLFFISC